MTPWVMCAFMLAAAVGAAMVVLNRNPVYSALSLVLTMFALSGLYVMMGAYFVAAVQVLVYAGAVVVLFLFVIMLLNLRTQEPLAETLGARAWFGALLGGLFIAGAGATMWAAVSPEQFALAADNFGDSGHTKSLAELLFQNNLVPFEAVSLVLLAALIGVVTLIRFQGKERSASGDSGGLDDAGDSEGTHDG